MLNVLEIANGKDVMRSPIFPGSSCFPLSPVNNVNNKKYWKNNFIFSRKRRNRDQLNVIFDIIGTPTYAQFSYIEDEDTRRYLKVFTPRKEIDLFERFQCSTSIVN